MENLQGNGRMELGLSPHEGVVTTGKGSELASELVLLADWLVLLLVSSALTQTGLKEPKIKKPKAKPCIIVVFFILTPFWWHPIWPAT